MPRRCKISVAAILCVWFFLYFFFVHLLFDWNVLFRLRVFMDILVKRRSKKKFASKNFAVNIQQCWLCSFTDPLSGISIFTSFNSHGRYLDTMNREHCLLWCSSNSITQRIFSSIAPSNQLLECVARAHTSTKVHSVHARTYANMERHIESTTESWIWIVGWYYAVHKIVHTCSKRFSIVLSFTFSLRLCRTHYSLPCHPERHRQRKKYTRTAQPPTRLRLTYTQNEKKNLYEASSIHARCRNNNFNSIANQRDFFPLFWIFFFWFSAAACCDVHIMNVSFHFHAKNSPLLDGIMRFESNGILCLGFSSVDDIYKNCFAQPKRSHNSDKGHSKIDCWWCYYREAAAPATAVCVCVMAKILS